MKRFRFNVDFSGHTFIYVTADSLEAAEEEVQGELEFNVLGTLTNYHVTAVDEVEAE